MRWAGHVACMGEERGCIGKPEGNKPLGWPRHRWVVNIRMNLEEVGCGYMGCIGLAQDRDRWRTLVSAVMNLRVPWNAGNFLTSCKPVSFSWRTPHHGVSKKYTLILYLLTRRIWWTPNNTRKGQMGFNSAFEGLSVWCIFINSMFCNMFRPVIRPSSRCCYKNTNAVENVLCYWFVFCLFTILWVRCVYFCWVGVVHWLVDCFIFVQFLSFLVRMPIFIVHL
jgi:hypothetical protein